MHILIVALKEGSNQTPIIALAKELKDRGDDITAIFNKDDFQGDMLEQQGIPVLRFKWLRNTTNKAENMFFGWELKKLLTQNKFDVIYFNSPDTLFGIIEARVIRPRIKLIFVIHDPLNQQKPELTKFINTLKIKFLLSQVDEIISIKKETSI